MSLIDLGRRVLPRANARWLADWWQGLEHAFEKAGADERVENDTRFRMTIVAGAFTLLFAILMIGAGKAALFSGQVHERSGPAVLTLQRGDLTDRNGLLLATNLPHYRLVIAPNETVDRQFVHQAVLSALPELSRAGRRRLDLVLTGEERGFIVGGLTDEQRRRVHDLALGGLYFEEEDARQYPLEDLGVHVIGFADQDGQGITGVEAAFNDEIRQAGRRGQDVPLSIDLRVQGALESELEAVAADQQVIGAVGLVTNIRTGEVLAMASYPDFDPNQRAGTPQTNFINRAAGSVWEMGSTFKIFSIAAGLDSGAVRPDTVVDAAGGLRLGSRVINDFHAANRAMTVEEVFTHSSNIGTSRIAAMMGGDALRSYYNELGLLDRLQIGLAESTAPLVPSRWDANTIASASFGHAIGVTPLQMAAGVGAIMNGGVYVPLTLRPVSDRSRIQGRRVVSARTSQEMLRLMRLNVTAGSGRRADVDGFSVGGKTGTAEKYANGRPDRTRVVSSFVSVFPTEGPADQDRYLVFILLDEPRGSAQSGGGRTAGLTAAPAVGRVIRRIGPFLGVRRQRTGEPTAEHLQPLSEVEGMTEATR
jgi:cell division protein FtsI (penicillin-binding protein 3)